MKNVVGGDGCGDYCVDQYTTIDCHDFDNNHIAAFNNTTGCLSDWFATYCQPLGGVATFSSCSCLNN